MFGSRKEAEEKYSALNEKYGALEEEREQLVAQIETLQEEIDGLTGEGDKTLASFKADMDERIALAVEAGLATKAIYDVLGAETIKDAALATVKAVRSEGSTVDPNGDVDEGAEDEEERKARIEAIVKKTLGKE